ncbi:hypothetical protein ACUXAI_003488 [Sphingomonas sanguinis]
MLRPPPHDGRSFQSAPAERRQRLEPQPARIARPAQSPCKGGSLPPISGQARASAVWHEQAAMRSALQPLRAIARRSAPSAHPVAMWHRTGTRIVVDRQLESGPLRWPRSGPFQPSQPFDGQVRQVQRDNPSHRWPPISGKTPHLRAAAPIRSTTLLFLHPRPPTAPKARNRSASASTRRMAPRTGLGPGYGDAAATGRACQLQPPLAAGVAWRPSIPLLASATIADGVPSRTASSIKASSVASSGGCA